MTRVAVDIETVPVVDDPSFTDPSDWDPFGVVLSTRTPGSTPSSSFILRDSDTLEGEVELHDRALDVIERELPKSDDVTLLTYNGSNYDLPVLRHRYDVLDREFASSFYDRFESVLDTCDHIDLLQVVIALQGHRMPIDDALAMCMIESDTPRWNDGSKVTGADMLDVGPEIMNGTITDDRLEAATRYAVSDVEPLFELHDKLTRRLEVSEGFVPDES